MQSNGQKEMGKIDTGIKSMSAKIETRRTLHLHCPRLASKSIDGHDISRPNTVRTQPIQCSPCSTFSRILDPYRLSRSVCRHRGALGRTKRFQLPEAYSFVASVRTVVPELNPQPAAILCVSGTVKNALSEIVKHAVACSGGTCERYRVKYLGLQREHACLIMQNTSYSGQEACN